MKPSLIVRDAVLNGNFMSASYKDYIVLRAFEGSQTASIALTRKDAKALSIFIKEFLDA